MANLPDLFRRNRSLFSDFFHDLDDLFGSRSAPMSRMLETPFIDTSMGMGRFDFDISEEDNDYVAEFAVPGFKSEDIKVDVSGNMLTVCACTSEEKEEGRETQMRRAGRIQRTIMLPADVNSEEITANYENGMLELRIPKSESAKRRTIEIQSGRSARGQQQIQQSQQGKSKGASASAQKSESARH